MLVLNLILNGISRPLFSFIKTQCKLKYGCNIKLIITELCVELQIVANKFVKLIFYNDTS